MPDSLFPNCGAEVKLTSFSCCSHLHKRRQYWLIQKQLLPYQQTSLMRTHFIKLFLLHNAPSYWRPSEYSASGICSPNPSWTQDLSSSLLDGCFSLSLNITNLINLKARIPKTNHQVLQHHANTSDVAILEEPTTPERQTGVTFK